MGLTSRPCPGTATTSSCAHAVAAIRTAHERMKTEMEENAVLPSGVLVEGKDSSHHQVCPVLRSDFDAHTNEQWPFFRLHRTSKGECKCQFENLSQPTRLARLSPRGHCDSDGQ